MSIAWLGLGSNLDNPLQQLVCALQTLRCSDKLSLEAVSPFYQSQPWGGVSQPPFINAVACIQTLLQPLELLYLLQKIEKRQKRVRSQRWGPRTLDLDLLLFDALDLNLPELVIPHPRMREREFVIYPLHAIAPDLVLPCGERIAAIKARLPLRGMTICNAEVQP